MRIGPALFLVLALVIQACTTVNVSDPAGKAAASQSAAGTAAKSADKPKSPFKPWKEVLADSKPQKGLVTTHLKRDQSLLLELSPAQLGTEFGMIMHFSKGTGVFDIHDGLALGNTKLVAFRRVGDTIYLVEKNPLFRADAGTPMATSLSDNTGNSIISAMPILAEHDTTKAVLVDFTGFPVSDYALISEQIENYYGGKPVALDKSRSFIEKVQAFPRNVEIDAMLTYASSSGAVANSAGVSNDRSVPAGIRYSLFALPEKPMMPRLADDRVGYFLDAQRDFSRDKSSDQMVRFVNRWRLEKKDPSAAMSEPVTPIVYYIDRTVPTEYHKWVKEGIEGWQKAFEAAGFKNAIIAKVAPDDSSWSAEDMRYSTVRWNAADEMGYAIGPSQTDPRTGEILNADVLISSTFMMGWGREWQTLAGEDGIINRSKRLKEQILLMDASSRNRLCLVELGKQHQMGLMQAALIADGLMGPIGNVPEEYYGPAIRDLILHEVGHTLGLRHNFKGSSAIPYSRLQDKAFTAEHGLTLSVMDYAATNINPDRSKQGDYVNMTVGSYDVWAIQFGYSQFTFPAATGTSNSGGVRGPLTPEEELPMTRAIAQQGADPFHAFNTDEDTHLGPLSVDPLSNTWDLSSDPLAFARDRKALAELILPVLEDRLVAEGDGFQVLRRSLNGMLWEYFDPLMPVTKYVGGSYFSRDHKGDPNGRVPLVPVSAQDQRKAVALIADQALKVSDLPLSAELLNKTPPNRYGDWSDRTWGQPIDLLVHESVLAMQLWVLDELLDRRRLRRMTNTELRLPAGVAAYRVDDLLKDVTDAIFGDINANAIGSFERNLQLAYVDILSGMMNDLRPSPGSPGTPNDARALSRLTLTELAAAVDSAIAVKPSDRMTHAHLLEVAARIDAAFNVEEGKVVK